MNIAVVAPGVNDGWDEVHVVARRLAGAMAHRGKVTVHIGGAGARTWVEGALEIRQHAVVPANPHRAAMLHGALFGPGGRAKRRSAGTPAFTNARIEAALFTEQGTFAPGLADELAGGGYDLVAVVGAATGHAVDTCRRLPASVPIVLAPVLADDRLLGLASVLDTIERANVVVTTNDAERAAVETAMAGRKPPVVRPVALPIQTNELAALARPNAFPDEPAVVVTADWARVEARETWVRWASVIGQDTKRPVVMRAAGPGANRVADPLAGEGQGGRIDIWRWYAAALAVVDPLLHRAVGLPTVEAMTFGVPVVVPDESGASKHHAEVSAGGLWYRTYEELVACIDQLLDGSTAAELGARGKAYARAHHGDTGRFVAEVVDLLDDAVLNGLP